MFSNCQDSKICCRCLIKIKFDEKRILINIIKYFYTKNKISTYPLIFKGPISRFHFYFSLPSTILFYLYSCTYSSLFLLVQPDFWLKWWDALDVSAPVWLRAGAHEAIWLFNGNMLSMRQTAIMITVSVCTVSLSKASQVCCGLIDSHLKPNNGLHSLSLSTTYILSDYFTRIYFFPLLLQLKG